MSTDRAVQFAVHRNVTAFDSCHAMCLCPPACTEQQLAASTYGCYCLFLMCKPPTSHRIRVEQASSSDDKLHLRSKLCPASHEDVLNRVVKAASIPGQDRSSQSRMMMAEYHHAAAAFGVPACMLKQGAGLYQRVHQCDKQGTAPLAGLDRRDPALEACAVVPAGAVNWCA